MLIINLLSVSPGTFVYHLLVLLALGAIACIALTEWRYTRTSGHCHILWASGGLVALRVLLLLSEPFGPAVIAPVNSGMEVASLILLGWAFLGPLLNQRTRSKYLVGGLSVTLLCLVTFLPGWYHTLAQIPNRPYAASWQQTFWYALGMLFALAPALIPLRFPQRKRQVLPMMGFVILFLGFTALCVASLLLTLGWFDASAHDLIGAGRLINLAGYPFFVIAVYRSPLHGIWGYGPQDASEEVLHQTQDLFSLAKTGRTIGEPLDLDTILRQVVESTAMTLDADRCAIFVINPDTPGTVNLADQYAPFQRAQRPAVPPTFLLIEQPTLVYALKQRKQLTINVETNNPRLQTLYRSLGSQETGPTIVQPLLRQRRILGALVVGNDRSQRAFEPSHSRLCESIAAQVAMAIENARLHHNLTAQTRQVTESLRSQKDEARRRAAILESITEGVIVSDPEGHIAIVNAAAERILGTPRQHILGHPLERLMDHVPLTSKADWSTIAQSDTPLETVFESEGRVVYVNAAPVLTEAGGHLGVVAVLHDISRETGAEQAKTEFVTAVSHELRTPLTAIRGYAEALSSGLVGDVSEAQSHFLKIIRDSALRMVSLTENLIAASQIEKGFLKLEYGETDLHLLVEDVVRSFQGQLEAHQLEVSLELDDDLPLIEADPARMRQILDNLVSNAIRFTYPGGHIAIGIKPLHEDEEQPPTFCSFWVSDTGIGIPPEEQPHIWKRFYRPAGRLAAETSGLGMGLSIVKSLVEAHSGRVWVESAPGVGSTFTVLIPIKLAQPIND